MVVDLTRFVFSKLLSSSNGRDYLPVQIDVDLNKDIGTVVVQYCVMLWLFSRVTSGRFSPAYKERNAGLRTVLSAFRGSAVVCCVGCVWWSVICGAGGTSDYRHLSSP